MKFYNGVLIFRVLFSIVEREERVWHFDRKRLFVLRKNYKESELGTQVQLLLKEISLLTSVHSSEVPITAFVSD